MDGCEHYFVNYIWISWKRENEISSFSRKDVGFESSKLNYIFEDHLMVILLKSLTLVKDKNVFINNVYRLCYNLLGNCFVSFCESVKLLENNLDIDFVL